MWTGPRALTTLGRVAAVATIKDTAHTLRSGLIGGYVSITDVVVWANGLIAEDGGLAVPQLFDLALLRPADLGRAVSLLGEVPGEVDPGTVGREIASRLRRGLASGKLTEREAANALFTALLEGDAPDLSRASKHPTRSGPGRVGYPEP